MGKRRLEKINAIESRRDRRVTFCKRKVGLLKKTIELSKLCKLSIFMLILDKEQNRCIHYASNKNDDMLELFNQKYQREFYSNKDYIKVGGRQEDVDNL